MSTYTVATIHLARMLASTDLLLLVGSVLLDMVQFLNRIASSVLGVGSVVREEAIVLFVLGVLWSIHHGLGHTTDSVSSCFFFLSH